VVAVTLIVLLTLILAGIGFAVHVLWWITLAVLVIGLVGAGAWTRLRRHLPILVVQVEYSSKESLDDDSSKESRDATETEQRRRWPNRPEH
jgi:hypothetical protein